MKKLVTMKKLVLATLTVGVALASSQAFARTVLIPGTVCQPIQGAQGCVEYSQYGTHNICATTITVECPLPASEPNASPHPSVYQVYYTAYDRHTTQNVSCTIQKTDTSGNSTYSATASTGGGGVGSGVQFPIVFPNVGQDGWWRLSCTIPGVQAGWFSHVTNILLGTTE